MVKPSQEMQQNTAHDPIVQISLSRSQDPDPTLVPSPSEDPACLPVGNLLRLRSRKTRHALTRVERAVLSPHRPKGQERAPESKGGRNTVEYP
ncbi:hypothetical protein ACJZ2D_010744 [Fusarium nematophilum]